jgi:hypothetical protein
MGDDSIIMQALHTFGERKHETCRFGDLTESWVNGVEPTVAPLCRWEPPCAIPPGMSRVWGGLVEFYRDCAMCECHERLP